MFYCSKIAFNLVFLAKRSKTRVNTKFRPAKPLYAIRKSNMFDSHYTIRTYTRRYELHWNREMPQVFCRTSVARTVSICIVTQLQC